MMEDFEKVMVMIESDPSVKCAVIQSGKKDTFIAGADINQLDSVTTAAEATALSKAGQDSLNRLENLKKPVVCAVNGQALGGGLELVMACHYRIASTNKKTVMAVPEVLSLFLSLYHSVFVNAHGLFLCLWIYLFALIRFS